MKCYCEELELHALLFIISMEIRGFRAPDGGVIRNPGKLKALIVTWWAGKRDPKEG